MRLSSQGKKGSKMRELYDSLHRKLRSVEKDMDENRADKKRMFSLLDSYDYRLEEAVKEIENLRCLVVKWKWNA